MKHQLKKKAMHP